MLSVQHESDPTPRQVLLLEHISNDSQAVINITEFDDELDVDALRTILSSAGKVAVFTGASRDLGAGIATLLGELGATVYVTGEQQPPSL